MYTCHRSLRKLLVLLFTVSSHLLLSGIEACNPNDEDGDGYTPEAGDCDDTDPAVHPGAAETCDGFDNDCDLSIDEDDTWYRDQDGDGYGDTGTATVSCSPIAGFVEQGGDCDDQDASIHPNAAEQCDGRDEDCDQDIDDGFDTTWYRDADGDGYGGDTSIEACDPPEGHVDETGDCDDLDASSHPGAAETCDGFDNDCDGDVDTGGDLPVQYPDMDGDGYGYTPWGTPRCPSQGYTPVGGDCQDYDANIHPGAAERCNDLDDDCDGAKDEGLPILTSHRDADGDGYGLTSQAIQDCAAPAGYTYQAGDCDDQASFTFPGALELCDHADNDCDAQADEGVTVPAWYPDADGDGFGTPGTPVRGCRRPVGYAPWSDDCDDLDPAESPGTPETCDGLDNDCDGAVDEDIPTAWYRDADGDGFGGTEVRCAETVGFVQSRGDCDDAAPRVHPGAEDIPGDGFDADCGGTEGPEPHVGLSPMSSASLQEALEDAEAGVTLWVGPGTWPAQGLDFDGRALSLKSTHFAAATTLDAQGRGRVLSFDAGEHRDSGVDGFTIRGGLEPTFGGAVYIAGSSPTLRGLVLTGNATGGFVGEGGALYLKASSAVISGCLLLENQAGGCTEVVTYQSPYSTYYTETLTCSTGRGGGMAAAMASPILVSSSLVSNTAVGTGGGLYLNGADPILQDVSLQSNRSTPPCQGYADNTLGWLIGSYTCEEARGGGVFLVGASPAMQAGAITGNSAASFKYQALTDTGSYYVATVYVGSSGGGIYAQDSSPRLTRARLDTNEANTGGGVHLLRSPARLEGVSFTGNRAVHFCERSDVYGDNAGYEEDDCQAGEGGGLFLEDSEATLVAPGFTGNTAGLRGGGLYARDTTLELTGGLFSDNDAPGVLESEWNSTGYYATTLTRLEGGAGGAVYLTGSDGLIATTRLVGNEAPRGAGLFLTGASPRLENLQLEENHATGYSTRLVEESWTSSYYKATTLTPAGGRGAAVFLDGSSPKLSYGTLLKNDAEDHCVNQDGTSSSPWVCDDGLGGGLYVTGATSTPQLVNLLAAYNRRYNLYADTVSGSVPSPGLAGSDLYNPDGENHNLASTGAGNLTVEPALLAYEDETGSPCTPGSSWSCLPADLHLALDSPLVNAGDVGLLDQDGSRSDPGIYGGSRGAGWDRDHDGAFDWFWPGTIEDAPAGFDPGEWDCDDFDATRSQCGA